MLSNPPSLNLQSLLILTKDKSFKRPCILVTTVPLIIHFSTINDNIPHVIKLLTKVQSSIDINYIENHYQAILKHFWIYSKTTFLS